MIKESMGIALKIIIAFVAVYFLNILLGQIGTIILVVGIFVLYVVYMYTLKGNNDALLETLGKAEKYLQYAEKKYSKSEPLLALHKSYGLFYLNEIEASFHELSKVVITDLKKNKHIYIYYAMKLKQSYENNDIETYKKNLELLVNSEVLTKLKIEKEVFEIPLLVMKGKYQKALDLMMEWIPKVRLKYFILELEYYLGICHIRLKRFNDAQAVLDFVSSKNMDFVYIHKCRKLLEDTKQLKNYVPEVKEEIEEIEET